MRFPELLWSIVSDSSSDAINWSDTGISIIIDYLKLKEEYLNGNNGLFKTNNIPSFVRQLNLYGFRKCNHRDDFGNKIHEFRHPLFVEGREDLMRCMKRKPWSKDEKKHFLKPVKKHLKKAPPKTTWAQETASTTSPDLDRQYQQPTSSMEQMRQFWWNNSVFAYRNTPWLYHNWGRSLSGDADLPTYPTSPPPDASAYYMVHPFMYANPDYYRSAIFPGVPVNAKGPEDTGSKNTDYYRSAIFPGIPVNSKGAEDTGSRNTDYYRSAIFPGIPVNSKGPEDTESSNTDYFKNASFPGISVNDKGHVDTESRNLDYFKNGIFPDYPVNTKGAGDAGSENPKYFKSGHFPRISASPENTRSGNDVTK